MLSGDDFGGHEPDQRADLTDDADGYLGTEVKGDAHATALLEDGRWLSDRWQARMAETLAGPGLMALLLDRPTRPALADLPLIPLHGEPVLPRSGPKLREQPRGSTTKSSPPRPQNADSATRSGEPASVVAAREHNARVRWAEWSWANALVETVNGVQRLMSWLSAMQSEALTELAAGYPGLLEHLPSEVGMALRIPDAEAGQLISFGQRLSTELVGTAAALKSGVISLEAAEAINDATGNVTAEVAAAVEARVLPEAPYLTRRQVFRRCQQAIAALDPEEFARRRRRAVGRRGVWRELCADGMARMTVFGPTERVASVWQATGILADAAATPDDVRTLSQRRFDTLVDVTDHVLVSGEWNPCGGDLDCVHHNGSSSDADIAEPESTAGGSEMAATAAAAAHATSNREMTTAADHGRERSDNGTEVGLGSDFDLGSGTEVGLGSETDLGSATDLGTGTDPGSAPGLGNETGIGNPAGTGNNTVGTRGAGDSPGAAASRRLGSRKHRRSRSPVLVNVHVPLATVLGAAELPGFIEGFGSIDAVTARQIASDATWRRILTDPLSGTVLDVGRTRYRPPDAMRDHVQVRDQTCGRPGCDQPAERCDLDHQEPFRPGQLHGGSTSADNLRAACRHHHREVDGGGSHLTRRPDGTIGWTTVLGRTYIQPPMSLFEPGDDQPSAPEYLKQHQQIQSGTDEADHQVLRPLPVSETTLADAQTVSRSRVDDDQPPF